MLALIAAGFSNKEIAVSEVGIRGLVTRWARKEFVMANHIAK